MSSTSATPASATPSPTEESSGGQSGHGKGPAGTGTGGLFPNLGRPEGKVVVDLRAVKLHPNQKLKKDDEKDDDLETKKPKVLGTPPALPKPVPKGMVEDMIHYRPKL